MSDEPLRVCPNCMGPLRKMIYPVGIVFKGPGFYATDSRNSSSVTASADRSDSDGKGGAKAEAKTDSAEVKAGKSDSKGKSQSQKQGKSDAKSKSQSQADKT